jgi:hypothetical protein
LQKETPHLRDPLWGRVKRFVHCVPVTRERCGFISVHVAQFFFLDPRVATGRFIVNLKILYCVL